MPVSCPARSSNATAPLDALCRLRLRSPDAETQDQHTGGCRQSAGPRASLEAGCVAWPSSRVVLVCQLRTETAPADHGSAPVARLRVQGQRRKRWIEESTLLRRMGADQDDGDEKQPQGKQREHELTKRERPKNHDDGDREASSRQPDGKKGT